MDLVHLIGNGRGDGVVVEMHHQEVQSGVVTAKVVGLNPTALSLSCGFLLSTQI